MDHQDSTEGQQGSRQHSQTWHTSRTAEPIVAGRRHHRPMFRAAADHHGVIAPADFLDTPIDLLRSCPVERAPMQLSVYTPVPRLHLLFVMLGLKQILIVDAGRLVGIVTREDLMETH